VGKLRRTRPRRHQAPTLIGCKLLKIASLNSTQLRYRLASLHQQQRNEIMKNLLHPVNKFFCIRLNLADFAAAGFCSGSRFKNEEANSRPIIAP
ncbi:hypothetical protein, partial [Trinickia terrae]|uniref:hypothetical protein n=1 Tax=Trinickia terrae TaxID=2571161 RepID=UPI00197E9E8B